MNASFCCPGRQAAEGGIFLNLKHAQYMMTILQEGSITAAAKKLFISQPSLSQMVKLVETNLGTPVFNRATDPLDVYKRQCRKLSQLNQADQRRTY